MKALITNTTTIDADRDGLDVVLFGRDPSGERVRIDVSGFEAYFYGPHSEVEENEDVLLQQDAITGVEYGEWESIFGGKAARVYTRTPTDTGKQGHWFSQTYEADVWFTDKFRIDTGLKAWVEVEDEYRESEAYYKCSVDELTTYDGEDIDHDDPDPRMVTFDIETDDREEGFPEMGAERILSLVAHSSEDDEYVGFIDLNGKAAEVAFPNGRPEELDRLHYFSSESDMLEAFAEWVADHDPDLLAGWNSLGFDIPYLVARMEALDVDSRPLSPVGQVWMNRRGRAIIKGRATYDLLTAYKRNSRTELRRYTLDYVAGEELGASKISHDKGYFEMYETDTEKFMNYNARDTRLTVEIDREAGVINFRDTLRKLVGVDWEATLEANDFIEMQTRRKIHGKGMVGPTANHEDAEHYEGGYVFEPFSGLAENVMEIDLSSLYPMVMKMLNASPEVKLEDGEKGSAYEAPNGVRFSKEKDGLFRELVDDVMELAAEYKSRRNAAEDREEHDMWGTFYDAAKAIRNALYGVLGWEHFFLYDKDTAEAITQGGQFAIKTAATYVESVDHEVLYGDTDSIYIRFDEAWDGEQCLSRAFQLCDDLNDEVYPEAVPALGVEPENCLLEMEAETLSETFFQAGKKKRYAKKVVWETGHWLDAPEKKISGFGSQRSDSSALSKETEETIIHMLLDGENEGDIIDVVFEAGEKIDPADPDWDLIGIPSGIGKALHQYETQTARVRGCLIANEVLNTDFGKDSKPLRVYLRDTYLDGHESEVDVLCYNDHEQLQPVEDELRLDATAMINKTLRKPLGRILGPAGIDVDAALRGQQQAGLAAYF